MEPRAWGIRLRRLVFEVLAAAILLSLAGRASLATGSQPVSVPAVTDNAAGRVPSTDNTAGPVPSADNGWVDRTHSLVEKDLFQTVVWFDHFFGDERMEITEPPESFLRWINELRWDQEERFTFRSTIRASLRLPRLKKRWKLVFSGETRGDRTAVTQEDPGNPGLDIGSRARTGSTELVYDIFRNYRTSLDAGAGVRVKIPPDAFVRTRFQHARPVAFNTLGRFSAIAFWDARDGFGESNRVDLEHWLALLTLLRWSNSLDISQKDHGWTWGSELSLLQKISPKSAVTFAGGASGSTHPSWTPQNYRVLARYRRNAFRKWLFLEGEPEVRWPRKEDGSRKAVWGAMVRVEILFSGVGPDPQQTGVAIGP